MTPKTKLIIAACVVLFLAVWFGRYEIIPTVHPYAPVVRLDRWTGSIVACTVSNTDTGQPVKCGD